jgi:hypothetical protein
MSKGTIPAPCTTSGVLLPTHDASRESRLWRIARDAMVLREPTAPAFDRVPNVFEPDGACPPCCVDERAIAHPACASLCTWHTLVHLERTVLLPAVHTGAPPLFEQVPLGGQRVLRGKERRYG